MYFHFHCSQCSRLELVKFKDDVLWARLSTTEIDNTLLIYFFSYVFVCVVFEEKKGKKIFSKSKNISWHYIY